MRVAYVTIHDASDVHAWSGLVYHQFKMLTAAGFEVQTVGNLKKRRTAVHAIKKLWYTARSEGYHRNRDPSLLRGYADQVQSALPGTQSDVVFSHSSIPIAYLETTRPVVFWTDATFAGLVNFYPGFHNLSRETTRCGHQMEQSALSRCRLAIYSSSWAARTAIEQYDVDPDKVKVVPFGANLESTRTPSAIEALAEERCSERCRLLFVGTDWERKGGPLAVEIARQLNRRGVPTQLDIVGCALPSGLDDFIRGHGFISKSTAEGRQRLDALYEAATFFVLPTRAECSAVVFAEASSFGLPSLATDVGGVSSAVRHGVNGWTLPLEASPDAYCDLVVDTLSSGGRYLELAASSFAEFTERLNWDVAGRTVRSLLEAHC